MVGTFEDILPGLYGWLLIVVLMVFIYFLTYVFAQMNSFLPWSGSNRLPAEKPKQTIHSSNRSRRTIRSAQLCPEEDDDDDEDGALQTIETESLRKSKRNPTVSRRRPIRKVVTTTLPTTTLSIQSDKTSSSSASSSSASASPQSSNPIEVNTDDVVLQSEKNNNNCHHDEVTVSSHKEEASIISEPSLLSTHLAVPNDSSTNTPASQHAQKTSSSPARKSHKGKKSELTEQSSSPPKVKLPTLPSSSPAAAAAAGELLPSSCSTELDNLNISASTSIGTTSDAFDVANNGNDGGWLCANTKTLRRRQRNKDNKQQSESKSDGNNNNNVGISGGCDGGDGENQLLQSQSKLLTDQSRIESDAELKSNQHHQPSTETTTTTTMPSNIHGSDSSQKSIGDGGTSHPSTVTPVGGEQSSIDQSVTTTSTSTSMPNPKRKRRNASRKTLANQESNSQTVPSIDSTAPLISSSSSARKSSQVDDEENGFELIEIPSASSCQPSSSSSASSTVDSELDINPYNEELSLSLSSPIIDQSQFPPLIKADNGDPISVTMEPELLEGGRHPQASKLLKLALSSSSSNNNNNDNNSNNDGEQQDNKQRHSPSPQPSYLETTSTTTTSMVSSSGNNKSGVIKRSKVRKAD